MAVDPLPIITLTTDFGLSEHYVGAMKGAILSVNPAVTIVDINHEIQPQHIEEASFALAAAWPFFPRRSIHVAVVDPGVGSERLPLAMSTPDGFFVGPDNGVLSAALPDAARPRGQRGIPRSIRLPAGYVCVAISDNDYIRTPPSPTFQGRDIFGPAAAHLSRGVEIDDLGERVGSILALAPLRAMKKADGSLAGRVIHVDRFGNLITNVQAVDLVGGDVTVEIEGITLHGLATTYGEGDNMVALIGSSGYLEIALPLGSAARLLDAGVETPVTVRPIVVRLKLPQ